MKLLLAFALICLSQALVPLLNVEGPIVPNSYLITFSLNSTFAQTESVLSNTQVERVYSNLPGMRLFHVKMTDEQLQAVREDNSGSIIHIEPDQYVSLEQTCASQNGAIWNLARVSNKDFSSDTYNYPDTAGAGVTSFIIDTGIYIENNEFEGRAVQGANFVANEDKEDCNGHGTHVAGTVGGKTYGFAKKVKLVAVKVLGCDGSGTIAGIIEGMNWVLSDNANACANPRKCNINMSLGGGRSTSFNNAATSIVNAGVTVVVAAGNSNTDACSFSPASADGVISVGATEQYPDDKDPKEDRRSTFSNFGTCVTVFAPGTKILSAWIGTPSSTSTISGTSMASPHVCGVASLIQAAGSLTPNQVTETIKNMAQPNVINLNCGTNKDCQSSPNLFLHHTC